MPYDGIHRTYEDCLELSAELNVIKDKKEGVMKNIFSGGELVEINCKISGSENVPGIVLRTIKIDEGIILVYVLYLINDTTIISRLPEYDIRKLQIEYNSSTTKTDDEKKYIHLLKLEEVMNIHKYWEVHEKQLIERRPIMESDQSIPIKRTPDGKGFMWDRNKKGGI